MLNLVYIQTKPSARLYYGHCTVSNTSIMWINWGSKSKSEWGFSRII